jgi:hypothetical protein
MLAAGVPGCSKVALSRSVRRGLPVAVLAAGIVVSVAGPGAAADTPDCSSSQLRAQQVRTEGAAGSVYVTVRFTNVGRSTCQLSGYPRVLFFAEDGRPLTTASRRNGGPTPTVTLRPAGTAEFFVRYPNPDVAGCRPRRTHRYIVTPPHASLPLLVESPRTLSLCPGTVARSPVMRSV